MNSAPASVALNISPGPYVVDRHNPSIVRLGYAPGHAVLKASTTYTGDKDALALVASALPELLALYQEVASLNFKYNCIGPGKMANLEALTLAVTATLNGDAL